MLRSTIKQCVDLQQVLDNLIRSTEQTYWLSFCLMSCLVIICARDQFYAFIVTHMGHLHNALVWKVLYDMVSAIYCQKAP